MVDEGGGVRHRVAGIALMSRLSRSCPVLVPFGLGGSRLPVLLPRAARFVQSGHFNQACIQRRLEIRFAEVLVVLQSQGQLELLASHLTNQNPEQPNCVVTSGATSVVTSGATSVVTSVVGKTDVLFSTCTNWPPLLRRGEPP